MRMVGLHDMQKIHLMKKGGCGFSNASDLHNTPIKSEDFPTKNILKQAKLPVDDWENINL